MKIGIIGSGNVGTTLGKAWANRNHSIMYSFSRDPDKLKMLAHDSGNNSSYGTPEEAADFGEVILLATPWDKVEEVLQKLNDMTGKIVIDCTNPIDEDGESLAVGFSTSGAEMIAEQLPGAHVIKAFNATGISNLRNPRYDHKELSMFVCGDHEISKSLVMRLAEDLGFDPIDAGPLFNARLLEPLAMLWTYLATKNHDLGNDIGFKVLKR